MNSNASSKDALNFTDKMAQRRSDSTNFVFCTPTPMGKASRMPITFLQTSKSSNGLTIFLFFSQSSIKPLKSSINVSRYLPDGSEALSKLTSSIQLLLAKATFNKLTLLCFTAYDSSLDNCSP